MRSSQPADNRPAALAPEELEIARLAPRKKGGAESGPKASNDAPTRLAVALCRRKLEVDDHAMYFRLKIALARGLRRPFRRALIEVDDIEGEGTGEQAFEVFVEPADDELQARAEAVVARVIRWRRWRAAEPDADSGDHQ